MANENEEVSGWTWFLGILAIAVAWAGGLFDKIGDWLNTPAEANEQPKPAEKPAVADKKTAQELEAENQAQQADTNQSQEQQITKNSNLAAVGAMDSLVLNKAGGFDPELKAGSLVLHYVRKDDKTIAVDAVGIAGADGTLKSGVSYKLANLKILDLDSDGSIEIVSGKNKDALAQLRAEALAQLAEKENVQNKSGHDKERALVKDFYNKQFAQIEADNAKESNEVAILREKPTLTVVDYKKDELSKLITLEYKTGGIDGKIQTYSINGLLEDRAGGGSNLRVLNASKNGVALELGDWKVDGILSSGENVEAGKPIIISNRIKEILNQKFEPIIQAEVSEKTKQIKALTESPELTLTTYDAANPVFNLKISDRFCDVRNFTMQGKVEGSNLTFIKAQENIVGAPEIPLSDIKQNFNNVTLPQNTNVNIDINIHELNNSVVANLYPSIYYRNNNKGEAAVEGLQSFGSKVSINMQPVLDKTKEFWNNVVLPTHQDLVNRTVVTMERPIKDYDVEIASTTIPVLNIPTYLPWVNIKPKLENQK
jgi:hypothetical protein